MAETVEYVNKYIKCMPAFLLFKVASFAAGLMPALALSLAAFGPGGRVACAADRPPSVSDPGGVSAIQPAFMRRSVGLYLTEKGERSLSSRWLQLLESNGLSLGEGYFPRLHYHAEEAIDLNAISKVNPEVGAMVESVRELLRGWFSGLVIEDPRPEVTATEIFYRADIRQLVLRSDPALYRQLGVGSGVVLVLEVDIAGISLAGERIAVRDLNNDFVGTLGFDGAKFLVSATGDLLRLSVPFLLDADQNGALKVSVIGVNTNLNRAVQDTDLDFSYAGMLVPDIAVEINGRRFPLNQKQLLKTFDEMKPKLLSQVKALAGRFVNDNAATKLNERFRAQPGGPVLQINRLPPVGSASTPEQETDAPADLIWGLRLGRLAMGLESGILALQFDSFAEDPLNPGLPLREIAEPTEQKPASLVGSDPTQYDLALTVSLRLINRVMRLSFERGFLRSLSGPDDAVSVAEKPSQTPDNVPPKSPPGTMMRSGSRFQVRGIGGGGGGAAGMQVVRGHPIKDTPLKSSCEAGAEGLSLFKAPILKAHAATAGQDSMTPSLSLHVGLETPIVQKDGGGVFKKMANAVQKGLGDGGRIRFSVDFTARLVQRPGQDHLHIQLVDFDRSSIDVDGSSLTLLGKGLKGLVKSGVEDELRSQVECWSTTPTWVGEVPLPPEILNLNFDIHSMRVDKNDHIVMFLNIAKLDFN